MPQELLTFTPSYCIVGAYRLVTDHALWHPIWLARLPHMSFARGCSPDLVLQKSKGTLRKSAFFLVPYVLISYPLTRLYVTLILSRSPFSPSNVEDAAWLGVSVVRYTTAVLVLGQVSYALEWLLRRQISKGREEVYDATVRSRGKGASRPLRRHGSETKELTPYDFRCRSRILGTLRRGVGRAAG